MRQGKKKELMPVGFDNYIWACYLEFLEENHVLTEDGGKRLKDGVEFDWADAKNRNPMVSNGVWKDLLLFHLYHFKYN
ncbi:MAG: hypothetical protein V4608_09885 [Bacteroidota bacterium]